MPARGSLPVFGLLGILLPAGAVCQPADENASEPPAFIGRVEGAVTLTRNAAAAAALLHAPVLDGDRVDTGSGRVALQWPDGTLVALDHETVVDIAAARTLRLHQGAAVAFVAEAGAGAAPVLVLTPNASATLDPPGRYMVLVSMPGGDRFVATRVDVEEGQARLESDGGALPVGFDQAGLAQGSELPELLARAELGQPEPSVALRQWADAAAADVGIGPSAPTATHLPDELRAFGPLLERHGSWSHDDADGWVWYPEANAGWRPYSVGVWVHAGYLGWTWAGADPWAWPTHHYGTWALGWHGRWYWRPGRAWAPARVWWAVGPGYVAWCPLDRHGRPAIPVPFGASTGRHRGPGPSLDPWRAWTTVPSRAFRSGAAVQRAAVDGRGLSPRELQAFSTRSAPPSRGPAALTAMETSGGAASARVLARRPPARTGSSPTVSGSGPVEPAAPFPASSQAVPRPAHGSIVVPGSAWPRRTFGAAAPQAPAYTPPAYDRPTPFLNPGWSTTLPGSSSAGIPRLRDRAPSPIVPAGPGPSSSGGRREYTGAAVPRRAPAGEADSPAAGGSRRAPPPRGSEGASVRRP